MKLFFKHLLRGIKKRPLQPIIIIFTVTLSVLVCSLALTIKNLVATEINSMSEAAYGSSDIVIKLNGDSKSRFMFENEAEKVLLGQANAVGTYELVFSQKNSTVFAKAVDFTEIDSVFDFSFYKYGEIREDEISTAILISKSFAKENKLEIGDKIELELFGKAIEYTVQGISKSPFFDGNDVMVDISGVMKALASESLFISVLDGIKPYSSIYIDVNDNLKIDECIDLLSKSEMFKDKNIVKVEDVINNGIVEVTLPLAINLSIILCCFLTAVVVFNSIFILSKQRTDENESFIAAGTKKRTLNILQYLEVILYWLIGAPIGVIVAIPTILIARLYLSLRYAHQIFSLTSFVFGAFLTLGILIATVTVFTLAKEKIKRGKAKGALAIVISLMLSISFVITLVSREKTCVVMGIVTTFIAIAFAFLATPYLISKLLEWIFKRVEKNQARGKNIKRVSLYYALKNIKSIDSLKNTSRLIASLVLAVVCIALVVGASYGNLNATKDVFDGDYIVLNATDRCYEQMSDSHSASEISSVYQSKSSYSNGYVTLIISSDNKNAFGEAFKITEMPKGNEAIISKTDARTLGAGVGDEVTVKLEGKDVTLRIKEIVQIGTVAIIVDGEHFGLSPNMLLVKAKDGEKKSLLNELTIASSKELATVISAEDLRADKIASNISILRCANMIFVIVIIYALIGMANNLFESYRARKEEIELYHLGGISRVKIAKMIICELGFIFLVGAIIGALGVVVSAISLDKAFSQLNFELLAYIKYLF